MKQINVYFDDEELKALKRRKGDDTWHNFILRLLTSEEEEE